MLRRAAKILRNYMVSLIVLALVAVAILYWNSTRGFDDLAMASIPDYSDVDERSILADQDIKSRLEPSYLKYMRALEQEGAKDTSGFRLSVPSMEYAARSEEGTSVASSLDGWTGDVLILDGEDSWVEYKVNVPEDGFYQLAMSYYALEGKRSAIVRNVQIDGEFPFFQSKKMEFQRMWREAGPTTKDNQGNEFNPRREEVFGWQYREFRDAEGKVSEPFRYYLSKGEHTIRINAMREPAAIGELEVFSPVQIPSYEQLVAEYDEKGYKPTKGHFIKVQAEGSSLRSDPTLRRVEDREPATEPLNSKAITLNSFGGDAWRKGGQWAEWEFEVPESGLYNIGARFGAWFLNGIPIERMVMIDGKVPFKEMNHAKFPFKQGWQLHSLTDRDEEYLFYLEEGKHTLRMEVQVGSLGEVFENVLDTTSKISLLSREILQITGTNPDPNRDWKLEGSIPNLVPRIHLMARSLDDAMNKLYDFGVPKGSSEVSTLGEARDQLLAMAAKTDLIPSRLASLTDMQSSLGLWVNGLSTQSVIIDYFVIKSVDHPWPKAEAPIIKRFGTTVMDFMYSFTKDYSGIGNVYDDEEVIDVWVARGRDWVQIIKQMVDEDFTPESGIKVNVNVIPAGAMQLLLLAQTSGLAPDVALGVEGEVPIDFAVRGGLVDLSTFSDYEEIASRFRPGALIPYRYNGGNFALPETQNFSMLFYRTDIMEELGVTEDQIPQTWEEVMNLIPLLQQSGMDFFYPHAPNAPNNAVNEFAPFLFQRNGDLYKDDGRYSDLDSHEALEAIKMWTGLYTNYKIEKQADFYNRFRTGEMPIGVADYTTYVMLSTAAPELTGWWKMQPIPGLKQSDGKINRSTGGLGQTAVMFNSAKNKDAAWEFMTWWTGADAQERFGSELESLLGVEARWNTANVEALTRLPWQSEDIDAVLEQWEWFREREVVLGGYYTTRHIANIWNEIVLNGVIPREAIENGVREINKELRKKREEFGDDYTAGGRLDTGGGAK
ncbi:extracellular solute-binding protein [Paenibacillus sp. GCM10012307]|uniref:Extracellular solute-binding protein n=1 Tax=Paenibacillus roseus TaxID=2798579 RepID=A0A934MX96_9BACL|nr:extracellular solute-binding protein [Paenibacillus roseus]